MRVKSKFQISITSEAKYQLVFSTKTKQRPVKTKVNNFINDLKTEYQRLISQDIYTRLT